MRRAPMIAAAAAALALSGCSGDVAPSPAPTANGSPDDDAATAHGGPADDEADPASSTAPGEDDAATAAPEGDGAQATADPGDVDPGDAGDARGGADGQAAAEVAQAFLAAMVDADAAACDHLVSFSDVQRPMTDVEEDYDLCVELLPLVLAEEVEAQGLDEEGASVLEAMEITGADVDGDTAVVGRDNVSPLFADSLGEETITLTRIDDRWYVDLDRSFEPADPR